MPAPSSKSKKKDQLYLSREEVQTGKMTISEKRVAKKLAENALVDLQAQLSAVFGERWVNRLHRSADREKVHWLQKLTALVK